MIGIITKYITAIALHKILWFLSILLHIAQIGNPIESHNTSIERFDNGAIIHPANKVKKATIE